MKNMLALIVFAFSLPVDPKIIIVAGLVIAVIILIGAILLFRSGGKKKGGKQQGASGAADWQRAQQQGAQGGWNAGAMPGSDTPWGQNGQAQAGWGMGGQNMQAQQQAGWNAPGAQPGWGMQGASGQNPAQAGQPQQAGWGGAQGATQQPGWGMTAGPGAQQQGLSGMQAQQPDWMAAAQGQQPGAWAAQPSPSPSPAQSQPGGWGMGTQGAPNTGAPWDAASAGNASNAWGQSTSQPGWGQGQGQTAPPAQPAQQAQTAYGGSGQSWGMGGTGSGSGSGELRGQGQVDMWGGQQAQPAQNAWAQTAQPQQPGAIPAWGQPPAPAQSPSPAAGFGWQQPQQPQQPSWGAGGMGQDATLMAGDADKTMLRPANMGIGYVRVEEGKEPGRVYDIKKETLSIGRSRESDIFLEDLAVSRLHASIVSMGNGDYGLKDEGSANGTKVNGQPVAKYQTFPLKEGDRIQLGQTVLVFAKR
jgi:hypothetical protein